MAKLASTKNELLKAIAGNGGGNPYEMVSGIVRLRAVDKWCNQLMDDGLIAGQPTDDGGYAEVTDLGKRWLEVIYG